MVRDGAGERDVLRHLVATRAREDGLPGLGRPQVVDAEIEGGDRHHLDEAGEHRGTGRTVEQRGDRATVQRAGIRVADELFAIRQPEQHGLGGELDDLDAERAVVRHVGREQPGELELRGVGHGYEP